MLQIFIFHHYMSERASGMSSSVKKRRWVLLAWKWKGQERRSRGANQRGRPRLAATRQRPRSRHLAFWESSLPLRHSFNPTNPIGPRQLACVSVMESEWNEKKGLFTRKFPGCLVSVPRGVREVQPLYNSASGNIAIASRSQRHIAAT